MSAALPPPAEITARGRSLRLRAAALRSQISPATAWHVDQLAKRAERTKPDAAPETDEALRAGVELAELVLERAAADWLHGRPKAAELVAEIGNRCRWRGLAHWQIGHVEAVAIRAIGDDPDRVWPDHVHAAAMTLAGALAAQIERAKKPQRPTRCTCGASARATG
jgi:hypothetical protein